MIAVRHMESSGTDKAPRMSVRPQENVNGWSSQDVIKDPDPQDEFIWVFYF